MEKLEDISMLELQIQDAISQLRASGSSEQADQLNDQVKANISQLKALVRELPSDSSSTKARHEKIVQRFASSFTVCTLTVQIERRSKKSLPQCKQQRMAALRA
jgi:hypothetical protein